MHTIRLSYIDGKFYLFFAAESPDKPENIHKVFFVFGFGVAKIASTSDGKYYPGAKAKNLRLENFKSCQKFQAKGTNSVKRLFKKRCRKKSRFAIAVNYFISKKLI